MDFMTNSSGKITIQATREATPSAAKNQNKTKQNSESSRQESKSLFEICARSLIFFSMGNRL